MITESSNEFSHTGPSDNQSLRLLSSQKQNFDLFILPVEIRTYLQSDQQKVKEDREQAQQAKNKALVRQLTQRLSRYHFIEDFFLYLVQQGLSTQLAEISPVQIEDFINQQSTSNSRMGVFHQDVKRSNYLRVQAKQELKAFFTRAIQAGIIQKDPLTVQPRHPLRLEPQNPSAQTQADCQAFQQYLQLLVENKLFAPSTAKNHYRYLLILLHDAEKEHTHNADWPVEVADLFADPKWVWQWLNKAENYANSSAPKTLSRSSNKLRLNAIRYIWLWLKSEKRVTDTYFKELKGMFSPFRNERVYLPGRRSQTIEPLSETEEQTVFDCIDRYSRSPILRLRDLAMFTMAIETTVRLEGLNSMRIENFIEAEKEFWVCLVRTLILNPDRPDGLTNWYISPNARACIGQYLQATGRDWLSVGPVWLTSKGDELSSNQQRNVISGWLSFAKCRSTRFQVLRYTGIDRLLNKYKLSLPDVQAITQCRDLTTLLHFYRRHSILEAAQLLDPLWASPIKTDSSDPT